MKLTITVPSASSVAKLSVSAFVSAYLSAGGTADAMRARAGSDRESADAICAAINAHAVPEWRAREAKRLRDAIDYCRKSGTNTTFRLRERGDGLSIIDVDAATDAKRKAASTAAAAERKAKSDAETARVAKLDDTLAKLTAERDALAAELADTKAKLTTERKEHKRTRDDLHAAQAALAALAPQAVAA